MRCSSWPSGGRSKKTGTTLAAAHVWMPPLQLERLAKFAFDQIRQSSATTRTVLIRQLDAIRWLAPRLLDAWCQALSDQADAILEPQAFWLRLIAATSMLTSHRGTRRARSVAPALDPCFVICSGWRLAGCNRAVLTPKPAFSSLDRVSLVPTADSWAGRSGCPVSAALVGSTGFQVSAANRASAHR
jgi:hypothetical protein